MRGLRVEGEQERGQGKREHIPFPCGLSASPLTHQRGKGNERRRTSFVCIEDRLVELVLLLQLWGISSIFPFLLGAGYDFQPEGGEKERGSTLFSAQRPSLASPCFPLCFFRRSCWFSSFSLVLLVIASIASIASIAPPPAHAGISFSFTHLARLPSFWRRWTVLLTVGGCFCFRTSSA